jgi:type 1 fimbria pilin
VSNGMKDMHRRNFIENIEMIYLGGDRYGCHAGLVMRSLAAAGKAVSVMIILIVATLSSATVAHAEYVRLASGQPVLSAIMLSPNIAVPNDPAVGAVLQSVSVNRGVYASTTSCPINESVIVNGPAVPDYSNIFLTNVPGLGVRYSVTNRWGGGYTSVPYSDTFNAYSNTSGYFVKVELVVVGPVTGGTLETIPSISVTFSGTCFDTITQIQPVQAGSIVTVNTCSVITTAIPVALPHAVMASLPSVGSTFGDTHFSIGIKCAAAANAYLALSDAVNPGNTSTVLSPSPESTAEGVGFQISSGPTVLAFGPDFAANGQAQTWFAGRMTAGANTIPLTASYVRTGPINNGIVKGLATFTMSYE